MPKLLENQTTNAVSALGWVALAPGEYILHPEIPNDGQITLACRLTGSSVSNPITQNGSAIVLTTTSGPRIFTSRGVEVLATISGRTAGAISLDAQKI